MKKFIVFLCLMHSMLVFSSEVYDVYQHQTYRYNLRVYTETLAADYLPSKLEFTQAKIVGTDINIGKTEEKFKSEIIQLITSEFQYFKLQTLFKVQLKNVNHYNLQQSQNEGYDRIYEITSTNQLKSVEIDLLSIVNGFAIYRVDYEMEIKTVDQYRSIWNEDKLSQFYIVHLKNGRIQQINPLNKNQQEIVKTGISSKLKKLYLLQTQKIKLHETERIRAIEKEDKIDFNQKIDFSDAVIYPYFSGVLVTFPAFTKSTELFNNEPFRIFIQPTELANLFKDFPIYNEIFNVNFPSPNQEICKQLGEDRNFELSIFRNPPKELVLVKTMTNKPLRALSIFSYKTPNDSTSDLFLTQNYYFNLNQTVNRHDVRDNKGRIMKEERFLYDNNNQLVVKTIVGEEEKLELYYYKNQNLICKEKFCVENDYPETIVELTAEEEIYFYIDNYRYAFNYPMVGKFDHTYSSIKFRSVSKYRNCTNYFCVVLDDNQQVIGVEQQNNELIDVLTDSRGNPIESYFDNGRETYFFDYDNEGKIINYRYLHDQKNIQDQKFEYSNDEESQIRITDLKIQQVQKYKLAHW